MNRFARRLVIAVIATAAPFGVLLAATPTPAANLIAPVHFILGPGHFPASGCIHVGDSDPTVTFNATWSFPGGGSLVFSQFKDPSCSQLNAVTQVSGHGHGTFSIPNDGFFYEFSFDTIAFNTRGSVATLTSG